MKKGVLLSMLGLVFFMATGMAVYAAPNISASLSASPTAYSGKCPAVITFNGEITSSAPGRVQYKFIRSDGANAPVQTLHFEKAGSIAVSTTWQLGKNYAGWEAIQVIYPQQVQSNKAEFRLQCQEAAQLRITARLTANPASYSGNCPAVIKFEGEISATAPCTVQYKFLRSDGGIDTIMKTLTFDGPGSKPVSTTWTLGGPGLPNYSGWEAIQVIAPMSVESNKAMFKMQCAGGQDNQGGKKPDLGMYGFLKLGKNSKEVKWNETITLTPADATLVSGGKPAFEVYYAYREYNGAAVPGPFKNKIFFNDNLVSQQTNLACGAMEIKNVHTQAYLGPQDGKLQIKIDADDEVAESREDNNFHFFVNIKFEGFNAPSGSNTQPAGPVSEDCLSFNPATTEVKHIQGDWKIVDGDHWMFSFGNKKPEADKSLAIIKHYRMNESCFVGRPNPSLSYLKVNGAAPAGAFGGEDCLAFNPARIEVKQINGDWKIVDGNHAMFSFGSKKDEADQALAIIKKYGFTHTCFVGRPGPSFQYLRK